MAQAQDAPIVRLSGTLAKVHDGGEITLGYRANSFPFSYLDVANNPVGYSLDLCAAVVAAVARTIDVPSVRTKFARVTAQSRFPMVVSGDVDLVCGVTTDTPSAKSRSPFRRLRSSPGRKLMVHARVPASNPLPISRARASSSSTEPPTRMPSSSSTTNASSVLRSCRYRIGRKGYAMVGDGRVDAFAADDVLLYGMIAQRVAQRQFMVVGDYLSYDPYGLCFGATIRNFAISCRRRSASSLESGDLCEIYHRWFIRRTPTGERLNLPISPTDAGNLPRSRHAGVSSIRRSSATRGVCDRARA